MQQRPPGLSTRRISLVEKCAVIPMDMMEDAYRGDETEGAIVEWQIDRGWLFMGLEGSIRRQHAG